MNESSFRCVVLGHKWGSPYSIGATGEWDCECLCCGQSADGFDDERGLIRNRWAMLKTAIRNTWHKLLCRIGANCWLEGWADEPVCVWCFEYKKGAKP